MKWDIDTSKVIWQQIKDIIILEIVSNNLKPNDDLPTVRHISCEAKVNPNTVQRAFRELEYLNFVVTDRTNGRKVTNDLNKISNLKEEYAKNLISNFAQKIKMINIEEEKVIDILRREMNNV